MKDGGAEGGNKFGSDLVTKFGIVLPGTSKAHPPPDKWWNVFKTIFEGDPNSLVHGVLFPQWQIKIPRALTAHLEAFGAGRVDRSGVKFDRLGKTTSGQPIFAVDDATAESIRATFVLDVSLVRSFGREKGDATLGLSNKQQEFLVALALWKIEKLLELPFRFRSGCHLRRTALKTYDNDVPAGWPVDRYTAWLLNQEFGRLGVHFAGTAWSTLRVMSLLDRISIDPAIRFGKPCIRGTRITVGDVLGYLAGGSSEDQLLEEFPQLVRDDIRACLTYAAERERRTIGFPAA